MSDSNIFQKLPVKFKLSIITMKVKSVQNLFVKECARVNCHTEVHGNLECVKRMGFT